MFHAIAQLPLPSNAGSRLELYRTAPAPMDFDRKQKL